MSRRSRVARRTAGALAAALTATTVSACGGTSAPTAASAAAPTTSLAVSLPLASGTWATLSMGARSGLKRFWELFYRERDSSRWTLRTPPGVADNGGLVLAGGSPSELLGGFLPSQHLHFSPLAATRDGGRSWAAEVLPTGLRPGPDSLATTAGGETLALSPKDAGEVLAQRSAEASWRTVATARSLARTPAARACAPRQIYAIAAAPGDAAIVASVCAKAGQAGLFARSASTWRAIAPAPPASLAGTPARTLRLADVGATTFTLTRFAAAGGSELVAAWSKDGGNHWAQTGPLRLPKGAQVLSAGPGQGRTAYLLTGSGARASALWTVAGPGAAWQRQPAPPAGTGVVALAGKNLDALVTHGTSSEVTSMSLDAASGRWRAIQTIHVPLRLSSSE